MKQRDDWTILKAPLLLLLAGDADQLSPQSLYRVIVLEVMVILIMMMTATGDLRDSRSFYTLTL